MSSVKKKATSRGLTAEAAVLVANEHILFHYPSSFTGGPAQHLALNDGGWWIVPIVLTSPGSGIVGITGVAAVDARSGQVVGATSRPEVLAAAQRLREGKHDALEAAFLCAKTA